MMLQKQLLPANFFFFVTGPCKNFTVTLLLFCQQLLLLNFYTFVVAIIICNNYCCHILNILTIVVC